MPQAAPSRRVATAQREHDDGVGRPVVIRPARLFLLLLLLPAAACREAPAQASSHGAPLDSVVSVAPQPPVQAPTIPLARVVALIQERVKASGKEVAALYDESFVPLWLDENGAPTASAKDALTALRAASEDGLDPRAYRASALDSLQQVLESATTREPAALSRFDVLLSSGMLRFLRDLHVGRVDPRRLGLQLKLPPDPHDFAAMLRAALADGRITAVVAEQRPPFALYGRLREMLARYRTLRDSITDSLPTPRRSIEPGQPWQALPALHRRLVLLGDLPATTPPPADSAVYDSVLVAAVRHFQERHVLTADGVLGRGTIAALNVPLQKRIEQIELSLERLRWLPDLRGGPLIAVNIPTFHLWAWDSIDATGTPVLDMAVIVGKSLDTRTPVFAEQMEYVIFRPYWNVPASIARNETVPAIRRDPAYLTRNDMEIVQGQGDDARPLAPTAANIDLLARGQLRVRQRPGPRNSLGLVKFMFPNSSNVYLHDTPADELFSRARRDFSHGCVRVANPIGLAEFVLRGQPGWDRQRITDAMENGVTLRVDLPRPIPVLLFYITALVTPEGTPFFAADIYRQDVGLLAALRQRT